MDDLYSTTNTGERGNWEEFVTALDDDDECDSAMHYGDIEQAGPPVRSLEFPTPILFPSCLVSVTALDHLSGTSRVIDNVLMRKEGRSPPFKAYLIRKKISKTTHGSLRLAVVLKRRGEEETDACEVPWISTEELVAVKISSWAKIRQLRGQQHLEDPVCEVAALQLLGNYHEHVVGCVEVLQDDKSLYTILPYYRPANLQGMLFSDQDHSSGSTTDGQDISLPPTLTPNEDDARRIFRQLLKGLQQFQQKGICHRDISLDNLLISKTNLELKIVDLGQSLRVPYSDPSNEGGITDVSEGTVRRLLKRQGRGGRPMYLAPELLAEQEAYDGFAVDLWAAGVVLFVLCVGLAPFKFAEPSEKRFANISSGGLKTLMKNLKICLSPEICDLLQKMLWADPRQRLSLLEVMRHPWVMGEQSMAISSSPSLHNDVSSEASIGSLSTTEPTSDCESPSKARSLPSTPKSISLRPESRESASEVRDSSFPEAGYHANQPFHRIGPKLKQAMVHIGARANNNSSPKPNQKKTSGNQQSSPSTPSKLSPLRRAAATQHILNRLRTVIPNKTT